MTSWRYFHRRAPLGVFTLPVGEKTRSEIRPKRFAVLRAIRYSPSNAFFCSLLPSFPYMLNE